MATPYNTVSDYIESLESDRREACLKLQRTIQDHLPIGFQEAIQYKMPSYNVPHELYPAGYHCAPKEPLPFICFASLKAGIHFYHMGIYADEKLFNWFQTEYPKHSSAKLDMGKSCIRFKKMDQIPYELIGELVSKVSVKDWINIYENKFKKK